MPRDDGPWAHPPRTPPRRTFWRAAPPALVVALALALATAHALTAPAPSTLAIQETATCPTD